MKLNISLPEKTAEYVAKGVKELTDTQKEIIYKILREELQAIPESERVAFCIFIAGYCGVQF
ncbi:MAG: hypothetical protein LBG52_05705 [Candidatus Peribacteria bacterium]|jgi:hypothetical protein|nr:hypothetical protein [Candidatus Peribacteria bacterium]